MNNPIIKKELQKMSLLFIIIYCCTCNAEKQIAIDELITVYSKNTSDSLKLDCASFIKKNMSDLTSERALFYNRRSAKINIRLDTMRSEESLLSVIDRYNLIYSSEVLQDAQYIESGLLKTNIDMALSSWNKYPWSQCVPKEVFLNYLLPYKVFDEYPEEWRSYFLKKYQDSLAAFLREDVNNSLSIYNMDANEIYYRIIVAETEGWFKYANYFTKLTSSPSLNELLCIRKGGCYETSLLNVYILRALGIPATVDIVPLWGSRNGSHASEVFWNGKDKMRTASGREFEKPAKVFRLSFKKQNKWTDSIKPYVKEKLFLLPFIENDHWIDVTEEHNKVLTLEIPVQSCNSRFAYLCVYNYGEWQPVFCGKISNGIAKFEKMGYPMIYRVGLPENDGYTLTDRILMVDDKRNLSYPLVDSSRKISVTLQKINTGDSSFIKRGKSYSLEYLDINNRWMPVGEKKCVQDSVLCFNNVPGKGLYRLIEATGKKRLERIFTYENTGQVWW
ncbi:MAG: hypothetical protein ACTHLE_03220 [Agriterribacter sp.]